MPSITFNQPSTTKLPPQNIEAEQSLLGALLIDKDAIVNVAEVLSADDFYRTDQHGQIYSSILELFEKREPIDLVTVTENLKKRGLLDRVGGPAYLTELVNRVPTAAHVISYARIIKEHSIRRSLITHSTQFITKAYDGEVGVDQIIEESEQAIFSLSQAHAKKDFIQLKDALAESFDRLDELQKSSGRLRGVPTGFRDLDNKLAGLQDSNLIIFAARPGQGKCLVYDSKIVHPDTGEIRTIEEYYFEKIRPILTLDKKLRLAKERISNFVNDGKKEAYRVTTATGRSIEVTITHPFLTISGWKKLSQLKIGDGIATPRAIPVFGSNSLEDYKVKLMAYFISDGGLTKSCPSFTNTNPKIISDFIESTRQFGQVEVRRYDSGGSRAPSYQVVKKRFEKAEILENFSQRIKWLVINNDLTQRYLASKLGVSFAGMSLWLNGKSMPSTPHLSALMPYFDQPRSYFLPDNFFGFTGENTVSHWLRQLSLMGKSALEKRIPRVVFTLTREKIALFLNRAFACDGSVYFPPKGAVVSYCSSSKDLIYDIQHLLLRFGILSKVRLRNVTYQGGRRQSYELEIQNCEDVIKFCRDIGIFGKEEKIALAYKKALKSRSGNNFSKDTLPVEVWNLVLSEKGKTSWREIYRRLGLSDNHNFHVWKRNLKRSTVAKIAQALNSEILKDLASSDIFWDKIKSIESVGRKQVYDLTVSETHNFVANDFFVHNTSFVLNVAQYVAVNANLPVGIFSLEMSQEELVDRLLVAQADIDAWKLKTGRLDDKDFDRLSHAMGQLAEASLFIDDTPGSSISEIRTKARRLQVEQGLKLIIVDYLQLIRGRNLENRVQEVSEISQNLKNLARELKVPVLAVSQLSRAVEARGTRKPQLADLRESGAIEQDADVVMFIYREDPGNMEAVKLEIAKHRNGPTGEIDLIFRADRVKFYGMERRRGRPTEETEEAKGAAAA